MTALRLAEAGLRVLVLERGQWAERDDSAWDAHAILVDRKYKSRTPYEADQWRGRKMIYPDEAVGGNSVFYGAVSLRFRVEDFEPRATELGDPGAGLTFPTWPLRYTRSFPDWST